MVETCYFPIHMDRRKFIRNAIAATAVSAASPAADASKMIGIQVGAVSFVDEGVEKVLDEFQQDASINTLFVATFTYGRGIAGRQVPGQPLARSRQAGVRHGHLPRRQLHHASHPEYYRDTVLQNFRAPDFGDYDVLEAVLPAARKRGMKTICWFEDVLSGRARSRTSRRRRKSSSTAGTPTTLCFNNPNYRNWLLGTVEDYARSYEIDGIMWGSERQGAFANMLGARHGTRRGGVTCFCEFCERKARERGIDVERARAGLPGAGRMFTRGAAGRRPVDGYYVTLWRLMLRYPGTAGVGNALDR